MKEAANLALEKYMAEKECVPALPGYDDSGFIGDMLAELAQHCLGVAAIENNKVIGFLTCYPHIKDLFGTSDGIFCPIHAHGTTSEDTAKIYSLLYQKAADVWVKQGLLSHSIALFTHDEPAIRSFFYNGFGARCVDAVRALSKISADMDERYTLRESVPGDYTAMARMESKLVYHLRSSPMFMPRNPNKDEKTISDAIDKGSRFFTASFDNEPVGFLEINDSGENFACESPDMKNVCGAYLIPEHRGKGVFTGLLSYVCDILILEGVKRLGVDYECFNPTANAFWPKYFTPYTFSVVRRIDERIYPDNSAKS